jgi:hypothetical protein
MNTAIKIIMHGLASGRVKSTPQVLDALKELSCDHHCPALGSDNSVEPVTHESEPACKETRVESDADKN